MPGDGHPKEIEDSENYEEEPIPHEPPSEERLGYYFGLAGIPPLVARTSCNPWVRPMDTEDTHSPDLVQKPILGTQPTQEPAHNPVVKLPETRADI
jgi:hypothetical protein